VISQTLSAAGAAQFEEEELDDEELGHAETYADYMPAKCESVVYLSFTCHLLCCVCFMCYAAVKVKIMHWLLAQDAMYACQLYEYHDRLSVYYVGGF